MFYIIIEALLKTNNNIFWFIAGALTKGDRRAATGADLTEFNFDTPYGRGALRAMYHAICYVSTFISRLLFNPSPSEFTLGLFIRFKMSHTEDL